MSAADEEWVKAAMSDDAMVVELLVRLHGAAGRTKAAVALPLEWTVRQRRSKPMSVTNSLKSQSQAQRASPTTPLSWSGATSNSGGSGGAGCEESSSRPVPPKPSCQRRSKVNGDTEKTTLKRSRKKKTLAELRVEESTLLKEKRELNREIAAIRLNVEKQRTTNESLKRMKIELQSLPGGAEESTSDQLKQKTTTTCCPTPSITRQPSLPNGCPEPDDPAAASNPKLMLPDLNIPFDENPCPDVIWTRVG
ncbi:uncharacterized protein LOC127241388 [Andrographis paniculata]|uniref:uncharacterized protein LOC127241388 n=1 Tax=Andrographis paniculata TaxID=175694 RepID=UPI0021E8FDCF|nr:uncharacterized protein LOC127241388 [Andrographis paniculata]